jgi:hypothetical protein
MSSFWVNDPMALLNKDHILEMLPSTSMSENYKLNALTRLVIVLSVLGYLFTSSTRFVIVGGLTVAAIVLYFFLKPKSKVPLKEGYENSPLDVALARTVPTTQNPMMNVLMTEYKDKPNRRPALDNNEETAVIINDKVKSKIVAKVGDPRIFRGMNNELDLEHSMRNFYTTASTTIPNDQEGFSNFCYGDMISGKEGNEAALVRKGARLGPVPV